MKHTFVLITFLLAACGGGGGGTPTLVDAPVNTVDAAPSLECNPIAQTGCNVGERCTEVTLRIPDDPDQDPVREIQCVPEGTVAEGGACELGEPGPDTGYDNCVSGTYCRGVGPEDDREYSCYAICDQGLEDSCGGAAASCVTFSNTFDDVQDAGLCTPTCDPIAQTGCSDVETCFLNGFNGDGVCAGLPEEAETQTHGLPCYGPTATTCYLNGCAENHATIFAQENAKAICQALCKPVDSHSGATGNLGGEPGLSCADRLAVGTECRYMNSFWTNTEYMPDGYGFCIPANDPNWLDLPSCAAWDVSNTDMQMYIDNARGCLSYSTSPLSMSPLQGGGKVIVPENDVKPSTFVKSLAK